MVNVSVGVRVRDRVEALDFPAHECHAEHLTKNANPKLH